MADATGLSGGGSRSLLHTPSLHIFRPPPRSDGYAVAAGRGATWWRRSLCSNERKHPPGEPVALNREVVSAQFLGSPACLSRRFPLWLLKPEGQARKPVPSLADPQSDTLSGFGHFQPREVSLDLFHQNPPRFVMVLFCLQLEFAFLAGIIRGILPVEITTLRDEVERLQRAREAAVAGEAWEEALALRDRLNSVKDQLRQKCHGRPIEVRPEHVFGGPFQTWLRSTYRRLATQQPAAAEQVAARWCGPWVGRRAYRRLRPVVSPPAAAR